MVLGIAFVGGITFMVAVVCAVISWAMWTGRLEIRVTERPGIVLMGEERVRKEISGS